jgi:hypothetical protein
VADIGAQVLRVVPGADAGRAEVSGDTEHAVLVPLLRHVGDVAVYVVTDTVGDHRARDNRRLGGSPAATSGDASLLDETARAK